MRKIFRNAYTMLCMPLNEGEVSPAGAEPSTNVGLYGGGNAEGVANVNDPNKDTPLEGAIKTVPDDKGGMVQYGHDANASALQQKGWLNNNLFRKVISFHSNVHPLYTAIYTKANQMSWKGHKEAEYPEIGEIRDEARTIAAYAVPVSGTKPDKIDLLGNNNLLNENDASIFRKSFSIFVIGVRGWKEGSTSATADSNETLELYVVSNNESSVMVQAINGPVDSVTGKPYFPAIPAGAIFKLGLPILAEEEVEVDAINPIPGKGYALLQKKSYAVALTDFFKEASKDVEWAENDIKMRSLDAYKSTYVTTKLLGSKRKFYKRNKNGVRICYSEGGILNSIRMAYELPNGKWTKGALIAIAKMLFTQYTNTTEIEVFCGSDAIESLLNIDWGDNTSQIVNLFDKDYDLEIATFTCPFGKLKFTHEMGLTKLHLEKAAIAIPMGDCIRLYRDNGTTHKVDGKKGETGEVEELTKQYFVQDDCFIVNALNSMLIAPSSLFTGSEVFSGITDTFISVESLPTPSASNVGKIYYLSKIDSNDDSHGLGLWQVVAITSGGSTTYEYKAYNLDKTRA